LGYNKVNALTHTELTYAVDLSAAAPAARLTVSQANPAEGALPCKPGPDYGTGTYEDLMTRCYWSYLRLYTRPGTVLTGAATNPTPGAWLLTGEDEPGTVVTATAEAGTQTFGTLVVVPFGATLFTSFDYTLAPGAVRTDGADWVYDLRVQKQAGTGAVPLRLEIRLPAGATVVSGPRGGELANGVWVWNTNLQRDVELTLRYRVN
jgi:hypothetical protein